MSYDVNPRITAILSDPTLLAVEDPSDRDDPSRRSLVEADLLYVNLDSPDAARLLRELIGPDRGVALTGAAWSELAPGHDQDRAEQFLGHLNNELRLQLVSLRPRRLVDSRLNILELIDELDPPKTPAPGQSILSTRTLSTVPVYTFAVWSPGPSGPPVPTSAPSDTRSPRAHTSKSVRIAVLDDGAPENVSGIHAHLAGVAEVPVDSDFASPYTSAGKLHLDAGHGLFIMDLIYGVSTELAPVIMALVTRDDVVTISDIAITKFLHEISTDVVERGGGRLIVNMSFSATRNGEDALSGLRAELKSLEKSQPDVLCVVAAGNDSSTAKTWPAAYSQSLANVVSVGALTPGTEEVAEFSNRGDWVQAWTDGSGLTAAYLPGEYPDPVETFPAEPRTDSYATWQGTSFAAPRIAAAIALQSMTADQSPRDAWAALRDAQPVRHPVGETGVIIDVP